MSTATSSLISSTEPSQSTGRLTAAPSKVDNVQYLRAAAALIVVASHITINLGKSLGVSLPLPMPGPFGVEIFFVISGFIITHTSLNRFGRPGAVLVFANHRFWRVAPLYWIVTSLYLVISFAAPNLLYKGYTSVAHTAASYAFLPWRHANGSMDPIYVAGWSLNFEMFFYVLFSLVLWLPWRIGLAVVAVVLVVLASLHPLAPVNTALEVWSRPFILEFLVGVALAVLRLRLGARLPFVAFWPVVFVLLGVSVAVFHMGWAYPSAQPLTIALAGLIVATAIFCHDALRRGPVLRALTAVGDSSYSLYLVHMFAVRIVIKTLEAAHVLHRLPWGVSWALSLLAALALGWASYKGLERGLIPAVRRKLEGRRPAPPGADGLAGLSRIGP